MLSLPDFRQKQVLFLDTGYAKNLRFQNNNLILEKIEEGKKVIEFQLPCHRVFALFLLGNGTFTNVFLEKMKQNGVSLFFLKYNFRVYASFGVATEGNTLLRKKQYTAENQLEIAKKIMENKIANQIILLKKIRGKTPEEKENIKRLTELLKKIPSAENNESLLGIEGNAAKIFFAQYFAEMKWRGRKPRTKWDETNTLLDMGYTILFHFLESHLRLYGFDIYAGVYHQFFYERKSLVCDLVEPFRCIIDRALRNAHNLGQIDAKDFETRGHQYLLSWGKGKKYARIFTEAIMENREEIFLFVQQYYRAFIREEWEKIPHFKIS